MTIAVKFRWHGLWVWATCDNKTINGLVLDSVMGNNNNNTK